MVGRNTFLFSFVFSCSDFIVDSVAKLKYCPCPFFFFLGNIAIFQLQALEAGIGLRLAKCLAAKDDDVKYWALSLVHEFVLHPQYRPQLIESGAFAQVINVGLTAASSRTPLKATEEIASASAYMWDILVMMWSSSKFHFSYLSMCLWWIICANFLSPDVFFFSQRRT